MKLKEIYLKEEGDGGGAPAGAGGGAATGGEALGGGTAVTRAAAISAKPYRLFGKNKYLARTKTKIGNVQVIRYKRENNWNKG